MSAMKSLKMFKTSLLILIFIIRSSGLISANDQLPDTTRNTGVPFTGLTKTLANLLKIRTPETILLGAYEIDPEKLIDDDLAEVFDCDSVIMQYLSDEEEIATYEMLSYEMRQTIESRLTNEESFLYVDVMSDTTASGMFFNITVNMSRPVSIPVVFNASDSSFYTAFDTTCTVEFNADIDLFVDAELALKDSASRATTIRINNFTTELYSVPWDEFEYYECFDCDWDSINYSALTEDSLKVIPFIINDIPFNASEVCFVLYAKTFWYLSPSDPNSYFTDEGETPVLSFEQIEKGEFNWEKSHLSALETAMVMIPATGSRDSLEASENRAIFQYTVDDLFDRESLEQIGLHSDSYINEGATLRTSRYLLAR
jgi:hypothetical protein